MMPTTRSSVEGDLAAAFRAGAWDAVPGLASQLDAMADPPRHHRVLANALWYASYGFHVFPVQPLAKLPFPHTRGCKEATTDPDQIAAWWRDKPTANIGLATGHVVDVIDFDGALGHEAWGRLWRDRPEDDGSLVPGVKLLATVSTPRPGGLHAYVPATGNGNHAHTAPGVDYRGRGGYVLAPPSTTPQGTYRFLRKLNPEEL